MLDRPRRRTRRPICLRAAAGDGATRRRQPSPRPTRARRTAAADVQAVRAPSPRAVERRFALSARGASRLRRRVSHILEHGAALGAVVGRPARSEGLDSGARARLGARRSGAKRARRGSTERGRRDAGRYRDAGPRHGGSITKKTARGRRDRRAASNSWRAPGRPQKRSPGGSEVESSPMTRRAVRGDRERNQDHERRRPPARARRRRPPPRARPASTAPRRRRRGSGASFFRRTRACACRNRATAVVAEPVAWGFVY